MDGHRVEETSPHQSLFLDNLIHSEVDLQQPSQLLYDYERQYAQVLRAVEPPGGKVDAFFVGVAEHLRPNGFYLLNLVDGGNHDFLRSELRTLRLVFPYVAVMRPEAGWPPQPFRSTYVIVARKTPPARALPGAVPATALESFVANGHSVVLTDDHAPVKQLLAPVFRKP